MRRVKVALAAGLVLLGIAIGLTLLGSPMSVAGTNKLLNQPEEAIATTSHSATYCQAHEVLPRGSSAIRVWLAAAYGPRVSVVVSSSGHRIADGERGSGWTGGSVTIPVKSLPRTVSGATVCASFHVRDEVVFVQGNGTPAAIAARDGRKSIGGRMWIEYLRPGAVSWASLVPSIMRHMGFGRTVGGTWMVFLALALLAVLATLTANAVLRELS